MPVVLDVSAPVAGSGFVVVVLAVIGLAGKAIEYFTERARQKKFKSIPPTSLPMTHSDPDETPTQRVTIVMAQPDGEYMRVLWERDEARRLYALAQDDLGRQQRATLQAEARAEVLACELAELRRGITGGHTRMPDLPAGLVQHVTEEWSPDAAPTPPHGRSVIRSKV